MPITPLKRFWTCHWQNKFWRDDVNEESRPIVAAGSNLFAAKGVRPGDRLYIVSIVEGQLLFGGRMTVDAILLREAVMARLGSDDLHEDSKWWAVGAKEAGTPLDLHRALSPEVTRKLRFVAPSGPPKKPQFVSDTHLDGQTTRGVRQLTQESAELLEQILTASDKRPRSLELRTISLKDFALGV